jgi:hypothetical protein
MSVLTPLADVVALAQTAEAAGFDQFWISNDLFLRSASVMLGAVGRATTRIELGIGILNPYTIHPGERAMIAATLDELTGCLASAPRRSSDPALDLREAKCSMPARLSGNQNGRIALWT